jgi:hypothetical protein
MSLLSISADAKTTKGEKQGYLTGILYLSPADSSGLINVCANATEGCKSSCLNTAGRGAFNSVQAGRLRKTTMLVQNRAAFLLELARDIRNLVKKAARENMIPCVRVNGTSDLPWLALEMARQFPDVQFYDYTKHPRSWERTRENYHLTFSSSETNDGDAIAALVHGINVAVVFTTKKGQPLPATWMGADVIDGDTSDLRFLDAKGVVVGLRAKGRAKKDCTGFVRNPLVQIGASI